MAGPVTGMSACRGDERGPVRRNLLIYAALMLPMLALLVAFHPDRINMAMALLAAGIMLVSFVGWPLWLAEEHPRVFPLLPFAGSFYGVTFGLAPFLVDLGWVWYQPIWLYNRAMVLTEPDALPLASAFAGITLFMAVWIGLKPVFRRRLPGLSLPALRDGEVRLCLWALTAGYFAWRTVPGFRSLPSVDQFFQPAGLIVLVGWFMCWRRGILRWYEKLAIVALLPLELLFRARDFLITDIMILGILVAMLLMQARMWKTCLAVGIAGLTVMSAYDMNSTMRSMYHNNQKDFQDMWMAYRNMWLGNGSRYMTFEAGGLVSAPPPVGKLVRRFSLVWVYHRVATHTPEEVPYWMGETYRPLVGSLVPRFIWPDKPREDAGFRFGLRYGFLLPPDFRTSLNIPWIVELRANFGFLGVIFGMAFFGLLMALLDRLLNRPREAIPQAAVGLGLIAPLVYPESNFSIMTGTMPLALAALAFWFAVPAILRRLRGA